MAVKTNWTAGQVLTASQTLTYLANSGLVYVTQVTVGSGVTYVSVPDAFNSTFDNYVINCAKIGGSVSATKMTFQFEDAGGTPNTGGYSLAGTSMTWGSTTVTGIAETAWDVLSKSNSHNYFASTFTLIEPNLVDYSFLTSSHSGGATAKFVQGKHEASSSWTRFRLVVDAGTVSNGTITVYGYRKA